MTAPTLFRSAYTGVQIDEILSSVQFKLDETYIVNGFTGGTSQVASAEDVKTLYDEVTQLNDPNHFIEIIQSIPGFNIFTDSEKSKLDGLSVQFKGCYANAAARDLAINTANLTGGEIVFLLDDGSGNGLQALQYWNNSTNSWVSSVLYKFGYEGPTTFPIAAVASFSSLDLSKFNTVKYYITATQTLNGVQSLMSTEVNIVTNGTDIWMTELGTIGNATGLINITAGITSGKLYVFCNTTANNVTVKGRKLVEM